MADNPADASVSQSEPRTVGQKVIFWLLWVLFLIPAILLSFAIGQLEVLLLLPVLIQLAIHGIALKWFLDAEKSFSKSMLMLLGGSGLMYFLILGSCVIMLSSLGTGGFH